MLEALIFVVFPFCMVFAAVSDTLSMTIANRVPLLLLAVFAVVAPLTGMDWAAYGWHFVAGAVVLLVTFGLFAVGGMGGGDAKLLTATAVWMGFNVHLIEYLVVSAFLGGVLTVAIVCYRGSVLATFTGQKHVPAQFRRRPWRRSLWYSARHRRPRHLPRIAFDGLGAGAFRRSVTAADAGSRPASGLQETQSRGGRHGRLCDLCALVDGIFINFKLITIVRNTLTVI